MLASEDTKPDMPQRIKTAMNIAPGKNRIRLLENITEELRMRAVEHDTFANNVTGDKQMVALLANYLEANGASAQITADAAQYAATTASLTPEARAKATATWEKAFDRLPDNEKAKNLFQLVEIFAGEDAKSPFAQAFMRKLDTLPPTKSRSDLTKKDIVAAIAESRDIETGPPGGPLASQEFVAYTKAQPLPAAYVEKQSAAASQINGEQEEMMRLAKQLETTLSGKAHRVSGRGAENQR